ncbi:MAG: hypothetical protein ABR577_01970 [Pyrinomonadaceae bacterium]
MTFEKIKEKIEDHITTVVFALIASLFLVIWQAVPSEVWAQIGKAIPKRALAALIGLVLIGFATTIAYAYSLHQRLKQTNKSSGELETSILQVKTESQAEIARLQDLIDNPPFRFMFGVYWDRHLTPYCPKHRDLPLNNWARVGNQHGFLCLDGHLVQLRNDEGSLLTPVEAKQLLSSDDPESQAKLLPPRPPDFEPDETEVNLLRLIATPNIDHYAQEFASTIQLHVEVINHHLQRLIEARYISRHKPMRMRPAHYKLEDKGRDYLIKNKFI